MAREAAAAMARLMTMTRSIEVDVWVRGTEHATTHRIADVPSRAEDWTDAEVERLLSEMLLALEREKNPGGDPPQVRLRGFSWIVSPYDTGGVLVHLEVQMGSASAGPLDISEDKLTSMIERVMRNSPAASSVH
jgi:hypothetical protein